MVKPIVFNNQTQIPQLVKNNFRFEPNKHLLCNSRMCANHRTNQRKKKGIALSEIEIVDN